jgi:hypothetical protein
MNYDFSFAGYEIRPGSASSELRSRGEAFLADIGPKLDQLVAGFGGFTAKDLELRSTIVYLSDPGQPRADLINRVHEVTPHFSSAQIDGAITELEKKGYVGPAATKNAAN